MRSFAAFVFSHRWATRLTDRCSKSIYLAMCFSKQKDAHKRGVIAGIVSIIRQILLSKGEHAQRMLQHTCHTWINKLDIMPYPAPDMEPAI